MNCIGLTKVGLYEIIGIKDVHVEIDMPLLSNVLI